jgi:hypothetical protein
MVPTFRTIRRAKTRKPIDIDTDNAEPAAQRAAASLAAADQRRYRLIQTPLGMVR